MESKLEPRNRSGLLVAAGLLIGAGLLAGFVDGILLHEILQWHHMITSVRPMTNLSAVEANTLGDGLFHLGTWTPSNNRECGSSRFLNGSGNTTRQIYLP